DYYCASYTSGNTLLF
nr:immunoglobulin light chain junction region [Macaca mulatta]